MPTRTARQSQQGVVLITAMLLLIVVTIMALSMFRSYGVEERIAGNTRDKQRALNAAESAQQYAEFMLAGGTTPIASTCPVGILPNGIEVCKLGPGPAIDFSITPWLTGVTYTQFTSNPINGVNNVVSATGTRDKLNGAGVLLASASYAQAPIFYITDLGPNAGTPAGEVYQIDALGYGGSTNTVAVVESTFVIGASTPTTPGNGPTGP
jgi:type IV pilus assembly protein PilX